MPKLNLTELDSLERAATVGEWEVTLERDVDHNPPLRAESIGPLSPDHDHWSGWTIGDEADARLVVASRNQLRPLLDLVERMGVSLEDAATALHADRAHEGKFWDCGRFGCLTANTLIAEWKQAKGRR